MWSNPSKLSTEKKQAIFSRARGEISSAESKIKEMDGTWKLLDNTDRAYYSQKMSSHRKEYEDLRKAYFQMEDNMNAALNTEKVNAGTLEGANIRLREGNRERLLNGVEDLNKADN